MGFCKIPNGYGVTSSSNPFDSEESQQDKAPDQGIERLDTDGSNKEANEVDEFSSKNRFCGRYLTTKDASYTDVSVCCKLLFVGQ